MARYPRHIGAIVLTLALGIGANATFFGFVEGVWTRPLPGVARPGELVHVTTRDEGGSIGLLSFSEMQEFSARSRSFVVLAASQRRRPVLFGRGFVDSTLSEIVSDNYLRAMGCRAHLGRLFVDGAAGSAKEPVLVMSYNYWQRRFAGDPAIVGRTVRVNSSDLTVIGVAAKGFRGGELWTDIDLWIPLASWERLSPREAAFRDRNPFDVMGRLRPGTTLREARAEADVIAAALFAARSDTSRRGRLILRSDLDKRLLASGGAPLVGLSLVGLVLLIAAANAANLLLARAEARRREIATRLALGCSRRRLMTQLLAESGVLATMAGGLGLLMAFWGIRALPLLLSTPDPLLRNEFFLDTRVMLYGLLLAMLVTFTAGLVPAFGASRTDVVSVIRGIGQPSGRHWGARDLLVGAQIAVSMFLLAIAALLARTFINIDRADLGFERRNVLVAEVIAPPAGSRVDAFYDELLSRLRGLPEVRAASRSLRAPLSGSGGGLAAEIRIPGQDPRSRLSIKWGAADASYFETLGIRMLRGRGFGPFDTKQSARVVIINETMARRFWRRDDPIGKSVRIGPPEEAHERVIIGVVGDTRINDIREPAEPYVYLPLSQSGHAGTTLLVVTVGDPLALAGALRSLITDLDPSAALAEVTTLDRLIKGVSQPQRSALTISLALGTLGLLLATLGVYAVMSYAVTRRRHEIGVRVALGARRGEVVRLLMGRGLAISLTACLIGLGAALLAGPALAGLLYGVSPRDWPSHLLAAAVLLSVAAWSSYLPAARATRIDPIEVLRCE